MTTYGLTVLDSHYQVVAIVAPLDSEGDALGVRYSLMRNDGTGRLREGIGATVTIQKETTDRETDMDIRMIDRETLEIAKLVAESEGISLDQAIREELELWGSVSA